MGFQTGNTINLGKKASEETKTKLSEINAGENNPFYGKKHSDKSKHLQSEVKKGKHLSPKTEFKEGHITWNVGEKLEPHSEERIRKQSESLKKYYQHNMHPSKGKPSRNKGKVCSEETRKKIKETKLHQKTPSWNKGIQQPQTAGDNNPAKRPEVRIKIAEKARNRLVSQKTRDKIANTLKGNIPWNIGLPTEKQPNWQGGISFEPYCHKFNKQLKECIRDRDDRTCQLCGTKENGTKHACHHIHYDKPNCNPDLITLCRSCNMKVNFRRDYWETFFMDILRQRGL